MFEWIPDLIKVLENCVATLGDHNDEKQLRDMAQECRNLAGKIQTLHDDNITSAQQGLTDSQWAGAARTNFDDWWKDYINPPGNSKNISDAEVIQRCNEAAKALDTIAEAAGQTKHAFNKLIASVIFWMGAGAALSAVFTLAGMAAAWAVETRVLATAGELTSTFASIQRMAAVVLRLLKPFTLYGREAVGNQSVFLRAMQANKTVGRWSLAGNLGATVLANEVFQVGSAVVDGVQGKPHQWTDPTAMSISQIGDLLFIGRFGGLTGPVGQTAGLTKLAANNSRLLNLGFGAVAGVAPLTLIDTVFDPKPLWDSKNPLNSIVVRWGMSAAVAGGFNAWIGNKFPGPGGLKEIAVKNSQDWQLIDRKLLDESHSFTPDGRPVVLQWKPSSLNPFDQELVPVAVEKTPVQVGSYTSKPVSVLSEVDASALAGTHRLLNTSVDPTVPYESLATNATYKVPGLSRIPILNRFSSFHYTSPVDPYAAPIWIPKDSTTPPPWFVQKMDAGKTIFTPLTALPIKATAFNKLPGTMAQSSLLSYEPSIGLAGMRAFATAGPSPHMDRNQWDVPTQAGTAPAPRYPQPPSVPDPPQPPPTPAPPQTVGGQNVTVSRWGYSDYDSLTHIAAKVYGDAGMWRVIYDANRHLIGDDPDMIRDGMVLKIPTIPDPAAKSSH
ncbi:hypothetical protein GCM10027176_24060 [Actinoallomurus bryophytorum]|uniref:Nucleoid-associated protein YgaU n=1 Tax=Actinoallomurus bryophytorum TaxID=1490222 RepID=A0A543CGV0_9ACTN|nr:hypothetical protein [Actinoallomurus bryophytorum]TQL96298.1 nucleoid-associated protein YgaU [Actinoallomurus bryophytorum]